MSQRKSSTPIFKVGEVVRIGTDFYKKERNNQKYQRIVSVWNWTVRNITTGLGFGYSLSNGDECHEKYLVKLTKKELGG